MLLKLLCDCFPVISIQYYALSGLGIFGDLKGVQIDIIVESLDHS